MAMWCRCPHHRQLVCSLFELGFSLPMLAERTKWTLPGFVLFRHCGVQLMTLSQCLCFLVWTFSMCWLNETYIMSVFLLF